MAWRYNEYEQEISAGILTLYPIIPPFKSLILRNTPLSAILSRHSAGKISIEELYHENSKLSKAISNFENIYGYFKNIKYIQKSQTKEMESFIKLGEMYKSLDMLQEVDKKILNKLKSVLPIYLGFYVLFKEDRCRLFKFLRPAYLQLIKEKNIDIAGFIKENIFLDESSNYNIQKTSKIIFVYGNHIVAKSAFGVRGYRVILFDCGRTIQMIEDLAGSWNLPSISASLFYDLPVNKFLGLDGRGFSVHGIILLGEKENNEKR
ncbi:MAG: hypothetical protein AB1410_08730 [Acidobacteriota bacterium]